MSVIRPISRWGVEKREKIRAKQPAVTKHLAMTPGKRKATDKSASMDVNLERMEV